MERRERKGQKLNLKKNGKNVLRFDEKVLILRLKKLKATNKKQKQTKTKKPQKGSILTEQQLDT